MAGKKGRSGGDRPRDQFAVSAVGGAGSKNGQPKRYIPGMKNLGSTGVETMAQQNSAPMIENKMSTMDTSSRMEFPAMAKLRTLLDDTNNPMEPQSTGSEFGRGPDSSILPAYTNPDTRLIENEQIVKKYLPAFVNAAKAPNAPDSFKSFTNYLVSKINV